MFALWFADESDFNLFPYLSRVWKLRGRELRVPTPGKNQRQPVFGAVNHATGEFLYTLWPRNNNEGLRLLLIQLVTWAKRHRKSIVLVLDNGSVNTAKKVLDYLGTVEVKRHLTVYWLPKYCPDLNDIEPLWGRVKENGMANILFHDFIEFQAALRATLNGLNKDPEGLLGLLYARDRAKSIRNNIPGTA